MLLHVSHIAKSYPGLPVLHDVSFTVQAGEIICLLGPSGCGKSTLLRIVAGLETPDRGQVTYAGADLAGAPAHRRNFGLMFQDYALFPHRDVAANIAFGLRMAGRPAAENAGRVREMLALVDLAGYERRRVTDLSGGEQQRVALARSLAPRPRLLMLDEPLGALDRTLREQLMNDLRAILKRVGVTALYVTHDQEEAFAIADRVLIMRAGPEQGLGGWVEQAGAPQEIYRQPATAYVARFLGFRNLIAGRVAEGVAGEQGESSQFAEASPSRAWHFSEVPGTSAPPAPWLLVDTPLGRLIATPPAAMPPPGAPVTVLIRPEAAEALPSGATGPNVIPGRLLSASFRGSYMLVRTAHGDSELTCEVSAIGCNLPPSGGALALRLAAAAITVLQDAVPERSQ